MSLYNGANEASVSAGGALKVDNSAATQPVSAASLPLPTGAATSAKQPALGTAGSASTDVLSVQGIASMTPLKTDGSAVTQPVSGGVTANAGTNLNTSALALESGGNLATIAGRTPANGQTTMSGSRPVTMASDQTPLVTSTATRTNVTAAAVDTSLLASNSSRKGAIFYNDSTAILYLAYGATAASATSYSVQIPANGFFELPPAPIFTGAIRGIWSVANGAVRITELS